jgi:hypothetical protein
MMVEDLHVGNLFAFIISSRNELFGHDFGKACPLR